MQDVRTEAGAIELENWYIAEKNSQPSHQHETEEAKRKAAAEKAAQEAAKKDAPSGQ